MASDSTHQPSPAERLVWLSRYSSYSKLVPLVLYLPLGLSLGVLRFFIFLHACLLSFLLPHGFPLKRYILRAMLCVTGLPVTVTGAPATGVTGDKKKVLICNHVSNLDPFILALLNPLILTIDSPAPHLHCAVGKLSTVCVPGDTGREHTVSTLKHAVTDKTDPLLFFPERCKTNGRTGILKFSTLPFELDCPIQPVTIQAYRYLFDIHVSTHSSSVYEDLFWCFMTPLTIYSVRYLPVTEPKPEESREAFVSRVQVNMAKSLGVTASELTGHDLVEVIKREAVRHAAPTRRRPDPPRPAATYKPTEQRPSMTSVTPTTSTWDSDFKVMLRQVKDVLPDTPDACILADLRVTCDVDATIANILDGRVDVSAPTEAPASPLTSLTSPPASFKAPVFPAAPAARHLSFQERKVAMLEAARLRYRLKHSL